MPVALVRITGPSFYAKRGGRWGWYRYRYPVQILGWYDKSLKLWPDIRFMAPGPGTFQLLKGRTKTRRAIEKWLAHLGVPSDVANAAEDGPSRRGGAPGGSAPTNRKPNGQVTSRFVRGDHLDGREGYEVRTKARSRTAEAKEDELVQDFRRVLAQQGRSSGCLSYTLPDRKVLHCDVYEPRKKILIEAKGSASREDVRMAIGQLLHYDLLTDTAGRSGCRLAVLLPEHPSEDIEELLKSLRIGLIWQRARGKFADSPKGQFV